MTDREKEWLKIRRQWVKIHPANHQGQYVCGICGGSVHKSDMELDHINGRDGSLFSDLENLQPAHSWCNRLKGSKKWKPSVSKAEYAFRELLDL